MNLLQYLGIKIQTVTTNQVIISINVTDQIKQPFGIVHGGINAILSETAASLGANAWLTNNDRHQVATGIDINTHHLRTVKTGVLKAVASKQSITIRLGAVDQSPYTENIRFSTGGFLYGREA